MYADDIVVLGDSEEDLQALLQIVNRWCEKWQMVLNQSKTNVVHFRPASKQSTHFKFKCGSLDIDIVSKYKYLGLWFSEHYDVSIMAKALSVSASRALGVLISKYKATGGFPLPCYRTLYDGMVSPILEYGSAIWGLKEFSCINAVHNRACRVFLGVRRHSPNLAIQAELGWKTPFHKQILNVTRLWCRLTCMCPNRLTKKVFNWNLAAARINKNNWCFRVRSKFTALGLQHLNDVSKAHSADDVLEYMDTCVFEDIEQKWHSELWNDERRNGCGNKLRTYRTFKNDFNEEPYLSMNITLSQRRALASLRCGVAPLHIETGRYSQLSVDQRTCLICVSGSVETEKHFLMSCNFLCRFTK